jgi:hypothetical protein
MAPFTWGTVVDELLARTGVVVGEFTPEDVHAARSRPPAVKIMSIRSRYFMSLPSVPRRDLPAEDVPVNLITGAASLSSISIER